MASSDTGKAALMERLREFDRVAHMLDMPSAERLNILNVTEEAYAALRNGMTNLRSGATPELERRLSYALPLMRRLARNTPDRCSGRSANKPLSRG